MDHVGDHGGLPAEERALGLPKPSAEPSPDGPEDLRSGLVAKDRVDEGGRTRADGGEVVHVHRHDVLPYLLPAPDLLGKEHFRPDRVRGERERFAPDANDAREVSREVQGAAVGGRGAVSSFAQELREGRGDVRPVDPASCVGPFSAARRTRASEQWEGPGQKYPPTGWGATSNGRDLSERPMTPPVRKASPENRPPAPEMAAWVLAGRAFVRGRLQSVEIGISEDGMILSVGKVRSDAPRHDVGEGVILPSASDLHVHFREPGGPDGGESIATGTTQAAVGGVALVGEMPNTNPPVTDVETLMDKAGRVQGAAAVDVLLYASPTRPRALDRLASRAGAFKLYLSPTTGIDTPRTPAN